MSSSSSPTTSIRAATISSCKERRTNSFPSLASLNPFRFKFAPETSIPRKPFLVAPRIWTTDTNAKNFGSVEAGANCRPRLARSLSTGLDKGSKSPTPSSRSLIRDKTLLCRYKEVHSDNGTDDFSTHTHRQKREAWERARQQGRDEARVKREDSEQQFKRGRMRTVSQDDQLTERGANPRTGVVSPYVTSDGSAEGWNNDYMAGGSTRSPLSSTSRRTSSGRWQQLGEGWNFTDSPVPTPAKLDPNDKPTRQVSMRKIQDKLFAQMPGADNPEPLNLSTEQIESYQQSAQRAYVLAGGSHGMLDPETLPTPRQVSPAFGTEGPRTPPKKMFKIRRKEVGSALIPQQSDETILVKRLQRSATARPPPIRIPSTDKQRVRIVSPSMAALGVPPRTTLDVEASFLGPRQQYSRIASAGQFHSTHPLSPQTNLQAHLHRTQYRDQKQSLHGEDSVTRPPSPTLNQFLPRLQFLHPSHFANLEPPSYRRPAHLFPPSLRSGPQKRQFVEDAATIITTTTLGRKQERPGMQKSEGRSTIPRAKARDLGDQSMYENRVQSENPLVKISRLRSPTKSTEVGEKTTSSECQQTKLCPNSYNNSGSRAPTAIVSHNCICRESSPSRAQLCQAHTHLSPSATQSSLYNTHATVPRETSSEPASKLKQVEDMTTDPIHRTLLHPKQPNSSHVERSVLQASHYQIKCPTTQNYSPMTSSRLKEPEIIRPRAAIVEGRLHGNQQSPQLLIPVNTTRVGGGVRSEKTALIGSIHHQGQQQSSMQHWGRAGNMKSANKILNVQGACYIASDQGPQKRDAVDIGITQTYDLQDPATLAPESGPTMNAAVGGPEVSSGSAPNSEGGVCFAGRWDNGASDDSAARSITTLSTNAEEFLSRQRSLIRRGQELGRWLTAIRRLTQPKAYLDYAQQYLWHMIIHIVSTLHRSSPAVKTLRSSRSEKVAGKELLFAATEVALALVYLLVLLNVAMLVRKLVTMVLRVVYWVWHPFTTIVAVLRWCLVT